jgi:TRAP transporter TAXI family solute receptor
VRADDEGDIIVIGTGPVTGSYYPSGGALCNLVNRTRDSHGLRCLVESTEGSADNLRRLREGTIDFAIVQSDWQYLAHREGLKDMETPFETLRSVASLHAQPMTVVAHAESGIASLVDLKGRKVDLGIEGSGGRAVTEVLIEALGWSDDNFEKVAALAPEERVRAFCAREIDAFILAVSHPNPVVAATAERCNARLVSVDGAAVKRLAERWPFYAPARIGGGLYRGQGQTVESYGTRATLVATSAASAAAVYALVSTLYNGLDDLARQHPGLRGLTRQELIEAGNSAPLHEGALRFFSAQGHGVDAAKSE